MNKKFLSVSAAAVLAFRLASSISCIRSCADDTVICSEVLAEAETGKLLYEENAYEKHPSGSLCKLMTVLLAAEAVKRGDISYDTVCTATEHANSMQGAQIWLMPGDKMTLGELMKAVIIGNANDAAAVISEAVSGTEERFTELMNSRADELGMTDTNYVNSSGYESGGAYTTAADTARLLCALSEHDELTEMFTSRLDYLNDGQVQLVTSNPSAVRCKGGLGFKAGFTGSGDGQRFYAAQGAARDGETYVSVIIGSEDEDYAAVKSQELLDYGFQVFDTVIPDIPEDVPSSVRVKNGTRNSVRTEVKGLDSMVISAGSSGKISSRTAVSEYVFAPVEKGECVGQIMYYYNGKHAFTADICAVRNVGAKNTEYMLVKMLKKLIDFSD